MPGMTFEAMRDRLAGVVAITVTPFDGDDRVDEAALMVITQRMVNAGVKVVTANGNTGEYYSLTAAERRQCLLAVAEAASGALVIGGVGGAGSDAVRAAREAWEGGADAVMVHQVPHPYITEAGWIAYHRAIAEAVPDLGLVPYIRSPHVTPAAVRELANQAPNFVGVKYALPDPVAFASMCAGVGGSPLVWIAGLAESYAPSLFATTATGFTSGLANVVPEIVVAFLDALRAHDSDATFRLWSQIREFEDLRARDGNALNVSVVKEALCQLGLSGRSVRPPISSLAPYDRAAVTRMLRSWSLDPKA